MNTDAASRITASDPREQIAQTVHELHAFKSRVEEAEGLLRLYLEHKHVPFPNKPRATPSKKGDYWLMGVVMDVQSKVSIVGKALKEAAEYKDAPEDHLVRMAYICLHDTIDVVYPGNIDRHAVGKGELLNIAKLVEAKGQIVVYKGRNAAEAAPKADEISDDDIAEIIKQAGGAWTLEEAAQRLKKSKALVHKRLQAKQLLGFMHGRRLVLPEVQFVEGADGYEPARGLEEILALFARRRYGALGILQWFIAEHPWLEARPIDLLRAGEPGKVRAAAETLLGLDQDG